MCGLIAIRNMMYRPMHIIIIIGNMIYAPNMGN